MKTVVLIIKIQPINATLQKCTNENCCFDN